MKASTMLRYLLMFNVITSNLILGYCWILDHESNLPAKVYVTIVLVGTFFMVLGLAKWVEKFENDFGEKTR